MIPSKFQSAIYAAIKDIADNLVVEAVAGSGKSTTLEHGVAELEPECNTAMFAFNRDIVDALTTRMASTSAKPYNLRISTINSFGWQICRSSRRGVQLDKEKTDNLLMKYFDMELPKDKGTFYKYRYPMGRLVSLMKANCIFGDVTEDQIQGIADGYGIDLPEGREFLRMTQNVWSESINLMALMDFSDQIYQPLRNNWPIPKFDVAMVDELQDLNPAQQNLMLGAAQRFIGVGDSRQAIYAFAGADAKSLANMVKRTEARVLPLSVCYRCPVKVVKLAQKIVPQIEWCEAAPEGIVEQKKQDDFRKIAAPGDFVLCRVTADLVSSCLQLIRDGKRAMVKGKEIGDQLVFLVDRLGVNDREGCAMLYNALNKYHMEQAARLQAAHREQMIEALNDRVETIKVLMEDAATVGDVKRKIKSIFSDQTYGVIFSTIHKAKGLESSRVFLLRPDLLPHPNAKTEDARIQEQNLEYVAYTRTKFTAETQGELYFVPKK